MDKGNLAAFVLLILVIGFVVVALVSNGFHDPIVIP